MTTLSPVNVMQDGSEAASLPQHSELRTQSSTLSCLVPALLTGGLLWMCYFPLAWGWLGWVALVPLLFLVRSTARPRRIYLSAWAGGLLFFVPVLQWMRVADPAMYATWIALAVYCSLFVPLGLWLVRLLERRAVVPLVVALPVVWTALEFFRGHFLGGFAWYFLGQTQHAFLPIIQIADLGGVCTVTLLVAAVNAVVFEWLWTVLGPRPAVRGRKSLLVQTAVVLLLVAGSMVYGWWRLNQEAAVPGPRVALLQGNVPQSIRNQNSSEQPGDAPEDMVKHFSLLCDLAAYGPTKPDLIVWPETCFPYDWWLTPEGEPDEHSREWMDVIKRRWQCNQLVGVNTQLPNGDGHVRRYNSSVLVLEDGRPAGRYDKMHLVPFGEYLPLRDLLPCMKWLSPYDFEYSVTPGERQTRFELGKYRFGTVICYEDSDLDLARQYVRPGQEPPVDFLVNTSNDGWFNGTSEHEEHLAVARFRAIECRRSLLRAVNMGISAVIDGNGRVLNVERAREIMTVAMWEVHAKGDPTQSLPLSRWAEFKKVRGVLTAVVPIDSRTSLYAAWGDWLPWSCWAGLGLGLVWSVLGRRIVRR